VTLTIERLITLLDIALQQRQNPLDRNNSAPKSFW